MWGIAAVLFCMLWIRSYGAATVLAKEFNQTAAVKFVSQRGFLGVVAFDPRDSPRRYDMYGYGDYDLDRFAKPSWEIRMHPKADVYGQAMLPWWVVVSIVVVPSLIAPWLRWRFTLRTLLIAITLIAIVLGLIVWLR